MFQALFAHSPSASMEAVPSCLNFSDKPLNRLSLEWHRKFTGGFPDQPAGSMLTGTCVSVLWELSAPWGPGLCPRHSWVAGAS